jgi:hypothetical protein
MTPQEAQQLQTAQQAASALPGGEEILADLATAAAIVAAGSAVPVVGTAVGAVVAAVVVLGPRLFKGISSLFGGGDVNPWPERERAIATSTASSELKYQAAWAARILAATTARNSGDESRRRWAANAAVRLKAVEDQLWAQLPIAVRQQLQPGLFGVDNRAAYRAMTDPQLVAAWLELGRKIATGDPGTDRSVDLATLNGWREDFRRQMVAVWLERHPPAPPVPTFAPPAPPPAPPLAPPPTAWAPPTPTRRPVVQRWRGSIAGTPSPYGAWTASGQFIPRAHRAYAGAFEGTAWALRELGPHVPYRGEAEAFTARQAYQQGIETLGALAGRVSLLGNAHVGAFEGTAWALRELGPHSPYRGEAEAFTARQAYQQGIATLATM